MSAEIYPHKTDVRFVFILTLFVGGLMFYLPYLCLFAHSDVQHMVLFCFVCLRLVYPMLLVSLAGPGIVDCSFDIL